MIHIYHIMPIPSHVISYHVISYHVPPSHSSPRLLLSRDHDLLPVLIRLSEEKSSVIVMSLAQKLVEKFKNTTTLPIQTNMQQPQQAIVAH